MRSRLRSGTERLLAEDIKRKIQTLGDVNMAAEADYREEKERLDFLVRERAIFWKPGKPSTRPYGVSTHRPRAVQGDLRTYPYELRETFADFFEAASAIWRSEEGEDPLRPASSSPPAPRARTSAPSAFFRAANGRLPPSASSLPSTGEAEPSASSTRSRALDDANIDRFLRVIREFSRSTQFIMVTHNKKTMRRRPTTSTHHHGEPGLSTLVSVRLSRTEQLKATASFYRRGVRSSVGS